MKFFDNVCLSFNVLLTQKHTAILDHFLWNPPLSLPAASLLLQDLAKIFNCLLRLLQGGFGWCLVSCWGHKLKKLCLQRKLAGVVFGSLSSTFGKSVNDDIRWCIYDHEILCWESVAHSHVPVFVTLFLALLMSPLWDPLGGNKAALDAR